MDDGDGLSLRLTSYGTKCQACVDLASGGADHVPNMAVLCNGVIHLYLDSGEHLCRSPVSTNTIATSGRIVVG